MKITAVCIGASQKLPGKSYRSGIDKRAVGGPVMIDRLGLVGDKVCNKKHHGGPDQAILIEGEQTLDWWRAELGRDLPPGSFGENLVIAGLENGDVAVGDRFVLGDVVLEATAPRMPCATLAAWLGDPQIVKRFAQVGRPGIYARVIAGGLVEAGMDVALTPYAGERIPIPRMMSAYGRLTQEERTRMLAAPIAERLRKRLQG
ncbi:MOSC domain-containing protein [Rhizobium sp. YJ-22]|uniref:MOSC domain-containing protein n=1 Tax=Rhizobium sp. YJ-22 TaxID=3037556 RepID=UPI00241294C3|nr:MOSC domain-containing protein [Rhizobium sp. YJ-22]MDG3575584.1 MOSC domain-containing protein [Rhizobium sp. YJ-22]